MTSFTNQTELEKEPNVVELELLEGKEVPQWDGRGIRLNTREEFIEYVGGLTSSRVRHELAREILNHTSGSISESKIDEALKENFYFITKNIPKEENYPVTINPGHHNSTMVLGTKRTSFHRGTRFLSNVKQVAKEVISYIKQNEFGGHDVLEVPEEEKGIIETFFIYSVKGENLPETIVKLKKEPKPKTAMEEALNEAGIKKSPRKEVKEVKASKYKPGIKPTVTIKGNEVVVRIPEGFSVIVETIQL